MIDTYKGESYAKKIARFYLWKRLLNDFPEYKKHPILVLASRNGGDIQVLRSLGVNDSNIVAVDNNKKAACIAQENLKIPVIFSDIRSVIDKYPKPFGLIFLDYCGPISESKFKDFEAATKRTVDRGIVALAVMRGREKGEANKELFENPIGDLVREWGRNRDRKLGLDDNHNKVLNYDHYDRDVVLSHYLMKKDPNGTSVSPYGEIQYVSDTVKSLGTSMGIYVFLIGKYNGWSGEKSRINWRKGLQSLIDEICKRDLNFQFNIFRKIKEQRAAVAGFAEIYGNQSMALQAGEAAAIKANVTRCGGRAREYAQLIENGWPYPRGTENDSFYQDNPVKRNEILCKQIDILLDKVWKCGYGSEAQLLACMKCYDFIFKQKLPQEIQEYFNNQAIKYKEKML